MNPSESVCTIVSMVPRVIRQEFPGLIPPLFEMPASDGTTPVTKSVKNAMHFVYLDETRGSLRVQDSSQEVARAICDDFCNSQLGVSPESEGRPALFWVSGVVLPEEVKIKHKEQYNEALRTQLIWMTNLVKMADNDWNRYRAHNVVSEFQILVARMLGWSSDQHEWMTQEIRSESCPACGTPTSGSLIICPNCRCVLKPEEYKNLQFA